TEAQALEGQGEHAHAGHNHGEPGHTHPAGPPPMDPACKREIDVEIPADVVAKHQEALVQQYSKQARIPGFRKGRSRLAWCGTAFPAKLPVTWWSNWCRSISVKPWSRAGSGQ